MPTCTLTRRVRFAAAHRYRRPEWDDARNVATFGPCAWPNFHGHSYTCNVTVTGAVDPVTGFVVNLGALDAALARQVIQKFDHRNINLDIPEFADGKLVPSGENLSRYILERLQADLGAETRVLSVTIAEDDTLSSTYTAD
ncbi:MAG: 6-carboxytetrahydropterin synthase [Gemmatimonadaceae bacterium]